MRAAVHEGEIALFHRPEEAARLDLLAPFDRPLIAAAEEFDLLGQRPRIEIRPGFEDQHALAERFRKARGQHAARRAGADHDRVPGHRFPSLSPQFVPSRIARRIPFGTHRVRGSTGEAIVRARMASDIRDFETLMALEAKGGDAFIGRSTSYPWGRVYGGQVVAQALRAASATVAPDRFVHSLHAYFIRGGDSNLPIHYAVTRVRDGGSFATREVIASQSSLPIMQISASFQLDESAIEVDVQETMMPRDLPRPESLPAVDWGPILERRKIELKNARAAYWLRVAGMKSTDRAMQACALAFASDDIPTEAANQSHPLRAGREPGARHRPV